MFYNTVKLAAVYNGVHLIDRKLVPNCKVTGTKEVQ